MAYINYKTSNPIYAPGLSTYSPGGEIGPSGLAGISIYYINKTMSDTVAEELEVTIANNILIGSTGEDVIECKYRAGDTIVDEIGDVYLIKTEDSNDELKIHRESIGNLMTKITIPFVIIGNNKMRIYNNDYMIYAVDEDGKMKMLSGSTPEVNFPGNTIYFEVVGNDGDTAIFPRIV